MTQVVPVTYFKPAWSGEPLSLRLEVLKEWRAQQVVLAAMPYGAEQFDSSTIQQFKAYRSNNLHARKLARCLVCPVEQLEVERGAREALLLCRLELERVRKSGAKQV